MQIIIATIATCCFLYKTHIVQKNACRAVDIMADYVLENLAKGEEPKAGFCDLKGIVWLIVNPFIGYNVDDFIEKPALRNMKEYYIKQIEEIWDDWEER